MIVLGMDTATAATSVALALGDGTTFSARDDPAAGEHPGHATRLLPMAADLLVQAGIGWRQLELIAVGVGPGAFTGLRVGAATARGLAQSLALPLTGFSSLRALAHAALAQDPLAADRVLAVIDARRGEVFAAVYDRSPAGGMVEAAPPRAAAPGSLGAVLIEAGFPHGSGRVIVIGDGAVRYRREIGEDLGEMPAEDSPLHLVSAAAGCELAAAAPAGEIAAIVPDYLRRPDAEITLAAAGGPAR